MKHLPSFRHSYPSLNALGSHGTSGCPSASAAELVDISNKLPPLTTSSSSYTFAQQRRSYSCDIAPSNESYAPLTEANLKYHTNKVASTSGRYKKSLRVELYVLSQKKILALEAELEQQRISESKAFVPLDSTPEQPLLTDVSQARVNKKRRSSSSKKFFSWFRATIASSSSSSSAAAGTSSSSITTTDHPSPLPATTTPPLSPSNNTSNYYYNQYRQEKMALIEQGLSNTTVASALGMNSSFASALFTPSSCSTGTSTGAVPKRDSGISFFAALSPRSSRRRTATLDGKDRRRRRSSISATENEACWDSNSLIAFRYPKMVHLQTLREAAIHALSSDIAADDNCCTATEKRTCCCVSL